MQVGTRDTGHLRGAPTHHVKGTCLPAVIILSNKLYTHSFLKGRKWCDGLIVSDEGVGERIPSSASKQRRKKTKLWTVVRWSGDIGISI